MENSKSIIPYEEKPIEKIDEQEQEELRRFAPIKIRKREKWTQVLLRYWKFASMTAAFAVIFFLALGLDMKDDGDEEASDINSDLGVTVSASVTEVPDIEKQLPVFMNESDFDIVLDDYYSDGYSLSNLNGAKILIIHSHNSEYISESISVSDAGKVVSDILNSAGISSVHNTEEHDASGSIGAYDRMRESVLSQLEKDSDIALVIDIHDSDGGLPVTFTVGTGSGFGWEENVRLACAVYSKMDKVSGAVRILPSNLGQSTGVLMLNIGIGSTSANDTESRETVAALARALISILINEDSNTESSFIDNYMKLISLSDDPVSDNIRDIRFSSAENSPEVIILILSEDRYISPWRAYSQMFLYASFTSDEANRASSYLISEGHLS